MWPSGAAVRRLAPHPADGIPAAVIAAVGIPAIAAGGAARWPVGVAAFACTCLALAWTRRFPVAVPAVVGALYLAAAAAGFDVSTPDAWLLPFPIAAFLAGRWDGRTPSLVSALAGLAMALVALLAFTTFTPNLVFGIVMTVGPWGIGAALRRALQRAERSAAGLERARLDAALLPRRAAEAERARIAAELHDVLTHTVGGMVVQATVGRDLLGSDRAAAARTFAAVSGVGRDALAETGRLLRLLRDDEADEARLPEAAPAPADAPAARWRPTTLDLAPAIAFAVTAPAEVIVSGTATPETLWIAAAALTAVVMAWWRRRPLVSLGAVVGIMCAVLLLGTAPDFPAAWMLPLGATTYSVGRRGGRWTASVAAAGAAWLVLTAVLRARTSFPLDDFIANVLGFAAAWGIGFAHGHALRRAAAAGVAQEQARVLARLETDLLVAGERRRIARELHDVLSSSLSVMIVQSDVAAEIAPRDLPGAERAADAVQTSGRHAMVELGALLRLAEPDAEGIAPRPCIADLRALAAELREAGLDVRLDVPADVGGVPTGVQLSTYRIVQEALTNVLRHAPGSTAVVRVSADGSGLAVEVRNGPGTAAGHATAGGHGLLGLRERVSHHGGAIDAGPTADGGFLLSATLPAPEPA